MYLLIIKDDQEKIVHSEEFENEEDMNRTASFYSQLAMYNNHIFYETEVITKETVYTLPQNGNRIITI